MRSIYDILFKCGYSRSSREIVRNCTDILKFLGRRRFGRKDPTFLCTVWAYICNLGHHRMREQMLMTVNQATSDIRRRKKDKNTE